MVGHLGEQSACEKGLLLPQTNAVLFLILSNAGHDWKISPQSAWDGAYLEGQDITRLLEMLGVALIHHLQGLLL